MKKQNQTPSFPVVLLWPRHLQQPPTFLFLLRIFDGHRQVGGAKPAESKIKFGFQTILVTLCFLDPSLVLLVLSVVLELDCCISEVGKVDEFITSGTSRASTLTSGALVSS